MNPLTWQNPEQLFVAQVLKKIFYNSVAELRIIKKKMKKMKLAAIFAGLVSVFTFSSCLNDGDSGPNYDLYEIVTVEDGSIFGGPVLKGDAWGYTYTPVASSVLAGLKASDGSYYKRVQVGIKLMEGEAITEGKKSYKVSEVGLIAILNYKDFNVQADTLKNEYALVSLEDSNNKIWAINGYVNVPFTFKTKEQLNMNDFHLYAVEAKEDTLVTRLRQTKGADDAYQTGGALISFHMPFNDMEFRDIFDQVVPKSDTIVVKVTAKGENDKELVSTVKCSASNMQGSY